MTQVHRTQFPISVVLSRAASPWAVIALLCLLSATADAAEKGTLDDTTDNNTEVESEQPECPTFIGSDERDDAHALTLHGIACFEAQEYAWALTHYISAFEIEPDPFLFGGIGRSLHELGLYEPAMGQYRRFLEEDDTPTGADRIRQRVEELEQLTELEATTVSLRSAPSGATAFVVLDNGQWYELGTTPLEVELREGDYTFAFDAEHYRPQTIDTSVAGDEDHRVDGHLVSEDVALGIEQPARRHSGRWMIAGGLVGTASATALLVLSQRNDSAARGLEDEEFDTLSDFDERQRHHLDRADSFRTWGIISAATGVTLLMGGALLYRSASSVKDSPTVNGEKNAVSSVESRSLQVEPTLGRNHLGVRLHF